MEAKTVHNENKTICIKNAKRISKPALQVWNLVKNFGNLKDIVPKMIEAIVVSGEGAKSHWEVKLLAGGKIRERMTAFNEDAMQLGYTMTETPLPIENYTGIKKVIPMTKNFCRLEISSNFTTSSANKQEMIDVFELFQKDHLENIRYLI
ncbi:SRPBCC family protein [Maribacter sp. 2307ULW6-5]|uniref:SRPBCC family protein n=1 Tax=Maribacter sp. 2307ULW6-5 TaxID=3386275 RepID=UPI0039BCC021